LDAKKIIRLRPSEVLELRDRAASDPEAARSYVAHAVWRAIENKPGFSKRAKVDLLHAMMNQVEIPWPAIRT
jgi:hypothetical protein